MSPTALGVVGSARVAAIVEGGPTVSDNFDRADNWGPTAADRISTLGTAQTGQLWTAKRGTWSIKSNQAHMYGDDFANSIACIEVGSTDMEVQVNTSKSGSNTGVAFRVSDDGADYYWAGITTNLSYFVVYRITGFTTQNQLHVNSAGGPYTDPADIKVRIVGTSIKCYFNGVLKIDITDSLQSYGTKAGIRTGTWQTSFNNFTALSLAPPAITDPTSIPNCSLWLDASDPTTLTLSGSDVTAWRDKSANAYNLNTPLSTPPPKSGTRAINTRNAVDFSGGVLMTTNAPINNATNGAWTIFGVVVFDILTGVQEPVDGDDGTVKIGQYLRSNNASITTLGYTTAGGVVADVGLGTLIVGTAYRLCSIATGTAMEAFVDGGTNGPSAVASQRYLATAPLAVGGQAKPGTQVFDGLLGEAIAYSRVLNATEIAQVEAYLTAKWITPPAVPDPTTIPGCLVWLSADKITGVANNGTIPYWNDSSGNGRRFDQQTGGHTQPYLQMNIGGLNGSSVFLSVLERLEFMAGRTEAEMCFTIYCPLSGLHVLYAKNTFGTDTLDNHWPFTNSEVYDGFGSTVRKSPGAFMPLNTWKAFTIHSAPNDWGVNAKSGPIFQTATNTVGFPTAGSIIQLGNYFQTNMNIADFVIYDHKLTPAERAAVFTYLTRNGAS